MNDDKLDLYTNTSVSGFVQPDPTTPILCSRASCDPGIYGDGARPSPAIANAAFEYTM